MIKVNKTKLIQAAEIYLDSPHTELCNLTIKPLKGNATYTFPYEGKDAVDKGTQLLTEITSKLQAKESFIDVYGMYKKILNKQ
jgi:hypothetical protein